MLVDDSISVHRNVSDIINNTTKTPTIVNPESNFVVITYWWGRDRLNRNTARPCAFFYEEYLKKAIKHLLGRINTIVTREKSLKSGKSEQEIIENIFANLKGSDVSLMGIISKMTKDYINSICDYKKIDEKAPNRFLLLRERYPDFMPEIKSPIELSLELLNIVVQGIEKNKENIIELYQIDNVFQSYKSKYMKYKSLEERKRENEENIKKLEELNLLLFTRKDPHETIRDSIRTIVTDTKPVIGELINLKELTENVIKAKEEKNGLNQKIIATLKKKEQQEDGTNKSIFDKLIDLLEYQQPIKFEEMIDNWEKSCRENNCNFLSVEYPEFAQEGGYQLAINAKPKFIEKALELCEGRSVLYIDGDMNIREYPGIFDMKNVDFMARGWWIDPRSSYKAPSILETVEEQRDKGIEPTVTYDPYNFETSGGTMFFSGSQEAKRLIKIWIETAEKPINKGKADDRVLSLVFNTKGVLTWIRVIQLPIEYLWLTLDYDDRLLEIIYDYNREEMESTIFIDHPECLTSEDTATGAGASSDRQPKFYEFLEDLYPCVETTHEYIMFKELVQEYPSSAEHITQYMLMTNEEKQNQENKYEEDLNEIKRKKEVDGITKEELLDITKEESMLKKTKSKILYLPYFFWYYHYMGQIQYINDGNPDLIDLGYVDPENPEDNVQPLNIISYKDRFGNKKHKHGGGESVNEIVDINIYEARELDIDRFYIEDSKDIVLQDKGNHVEIKPKDESITTDKQLIRVILRLLLDGKNIIYNPSSFVGYDESFYNKLITNLDTQYKDIDFGFHPIHKVSMIRSNYYRPHIDMNQAILMRPENRLIDFLSMQLSLEDLSVFINIGSYEFMSLVRIAFIFKTPIRETELVSNPESTNMMGGYKKYDINRLIKEYTETFENSIKMIKNKKSKQRKDTRKKKNKIDKSDKSDKSHGKKTKRKLSKIGVP